SVGHITLTMASTKPASSGPRDWYPASGTGRFEVPGPVADSAARTAPDCVIATTPPTPVRTGSGADNGTAPVAPATALRNPRRPSSVSILLLIVILLTHPPIDSTSQYRYAR